MAICIRNERKEDYDKVETLTRKAFYNVYIPGCMEHYLAHIMREHEDFVPELDFVLELNGEIAGNIMYTRAKLLDEQRNEKEILTFGPVSVAPEHQRKGLGKMLMEHSFRQAEKLGYDTVVIFGSPANYVSSGFKSCKRYHVCAQDGTYPAAMLVKELIPGCLDGHQWIYCGSPALEVDEKAAMDYDGTLEKMEKKYQPSQEAFYIMSHSFVGQD